LRWRPPSPHHVLRYGRLPDINAEHEEFAVDPRRTPKSVCNTHVTNELTNLQRRPRSATARSRFPAPIDPEAGAVPADYRSRFEDFQSVQHARSQTIQSRKHQSVKAIKRHALRRYALKHIELVSKNQDLCLEPCSRPEQPRQRTCQQPDKVYHRERTSPDSRLLASRMRFPVGTPPLELQTLI